MTNLDDIMARLDSIEQKVDSLAAALPATSGLITVEEVCSALHMDRRTYDTFRKRYPRQFITAKFGKRRMMRRETLNQFIEFMERLEARA